jgi:ATP-dependent protease ClpP protease subunit
VTEQKRSAAFEAAEISKIEAEVLLLQAQTKKESLIAKQHTYSEEEARRTHENLLASNSENRILDFIGPVTTTSAEQALATLSRWKRLSKEPITIRISSPGGQVFDGLALHDYILGLRNDGIKVTTVAFGVVASVAGILLQAGSRRVVAPNTHMLVHEISGQAIGKLTEQEDEVKFAKKLNARLYDILSERAKLSRAQIEKGALRKDWWLSANEVIVAGFADEVGFQ